MSQVCNICGNKAELRIGTCWSCAEAQSIIEDGTDMRNIGIDIDGVKRPAETAMEKLQLLIKKGWKR